jgi:hypothetical protein
MEPLSPSSPHSPVKAIVDKIYNTKPNGEALSTNHSKKTFLFQPKTFYCEGDENNMPTVISDMSPTRIRANRDNAVTHFRQARHANARYAAFKKMEAQRESSVRSKSESALASEKMKKAANKIMALQALTKTGGGGSSFMAKIAAAKINAEAKGEKMEQKMRLTEASSADLVVGRR